MEAREHGRVECSMQQLSLEARGGAVPEPQAARRAIRHGWFWRDGLCSIAVRLGFGGWPGDGQIWGLSPPRTHQPGQPSCHSPSLLRSSLCQSVIDGEWHRRLVAALSTSRDKTRHEGFSKAVRTMGAIHPLGSTGQTGDGDGGGGGPQGGASQGRLESVPSLP